MPRSNFFANFGLLAVNNFLDAETCARLRSELSTATVSAGGIIRRAEDVVDENVRRVGYAEDLVHSVSMIEPRLSSLQTRLEKHFGMVLTGCADPQFLIYRAGGFYRPHHDTSEHADAPDYIKSRKVSVVIFLNGESEAVPHGYAGGQLTFHGLMQEPPQFRACRFPLIGETGLLIAFRSDIMHEVTPVIAGTRYTIATWFH